MEQYDLIVIGAGCAGASGAMYATRLNLKTLMIGEMPGGLITTTHLVENWPGEKSISGPDLAMKLIDHALSMGVTMKNEKVTNISRLENHAVDAGDASAPASNEKTSFVVKTFSGEYSAKTILLATGTLHRKMDVPGEIEFANKGVSYCALCDGAFYRGKTVCVVGGSDSAGKEALMLAELAEKVIIFARSTLHPEPITLTRIQANSKIEVREHTKLKAVIGSDKVEKVILENGEEVPLSAVFVAIGHLALSDLAKQLGIALNQKGEIIINRRSETNIPGIYAAGDVTDTGFKQAITGSAEAVTAAYFAFEYLS